MYVCKGQYDNVFFLASVKFTCEAIDLASCSARNSLIPSRSDTPKKNPATRISSVLIDLSDWSSAHKLTGHHSTGVGVAEKSASGDSDDLTLLYTHTRKLQSTAFLPGQLSDKPTSAKKR